MSARINGLANPAILIWARESIGFTKEAAAKKLNIKPEKLDEWENGTSYPTIKQLRILANFYKRPLAIFYLPEKPLDFQPLRDFRRFIKGLKPKQSPKLNLEIRQAIYRRQIALNAAHDLYGRVPQFNYKINPKDGPEINAKLIRDFLQIDFSTQESWNNPNTALNQWRLAIENIGVLVFQSLGIEIKEMRGFSINEYPMPVIGLNIKDTPRGRIFTLLHELVHILLRESSICDINEEYRRPPEDERIETYCNHVAGATLIPKDDLLREINIFSKAEKREWTDGELNRLVNKFGASKETVLRRLLIFGLTTDSFYEKTRNALLKEYKTLREKKPSGFLLPYQKVISSAGISYIRLLLNGYHQDKVSLSDISDCFDVRLKHLPRIEDETMHKLTKLGSRHYV